MPSLAHPLYNWILIFFYVYKHLISTHLEKPKQNKTGFKCHLKVQNLVNTFVPWFTSECTSQSQSLPVLLSESIIAFSKTPLDIKSFVVAFLDKSS